LDVPGSYSVARNWKLIAQNAEGADAVGWSGRTNAVCRQFPVVHSGTMSMAERRYAQSGKAFDGSRRVGREFREYTRIKETRIRLFRVDSRSVFFG